MPLTVAAGPPLVAGTTATITTQSFAWPANAALVALVSYDTQGSATGYDQTVTSAGRTWTRLGRKSLSATSTGGAAAGSHTGVEIWYGHPLGTSVTNTVSTTSTTPNRRSLQVVPVPGAETVPGGAVGWGDTRSGLPSASVTTTRAGSYVFAVCADWTEQTATGTYAAGQTQISAALYTGAYTLRSWRTTNPVPTSGTAVAMTSTAPGGQDTPTLAVEIREAAATLTPVAIFRATSWNVAAPPDFYSNTYSDVYGAAPAPPVPVAVSRTTSWSVLVSDFYSNVYSDVYGAAPAGFGTVTVTRSSTWQTAQTVPVARTSPWAARQTAALTRTTTWVTRTVVAPVTRTTSWVTFDPPVLAIGSVTPGMRIRVYLPNGADQGYLPTPESGDVSYPLNDVGALAFSYAAKAPRASLLGQPCELAVEFSPNGGVTWFEPPSSRFVYISDGADPLDPANKFAVQARSYVWRLSTAKVYPNGLLNGDGKRAFLTSEGSNPGVILKTLLGEAQTRGALLGISHASFSTTLDSAGVPWGSTLTKYYEPGLNLLAVLQDLADTGFVDFRTQGRSLYVYKADTVVAQDRTVGATQVVLRAGRDLDEAPFTRTWEALADSAFFLGDGASYEYTNPAAITPWGRQEVFISNGSVSDPGTMAALTQNDLSQRDAERVEYTRGIVFSAATPRPFWDYGVGDYIWSAVDGSPPDRLRVRQVTLTQNDAGIVSGNVVLNDRFLELDVRARRRIEGITNGAQSGPGTGTPPVVDPGGGTDSVAPGQVNGLSASSVAFLGPGGFPQAQVTLTWNTVLVNANGTPADDIDHYEIFQRPLGQGASTAQQIDQTTDTRRDMSPYVVGTNWVFNVCAVDRAGNRGLRSVDVSVSMAQDTVPPQAPSTPVVTAKLNILSAYWDGLPATGTWPLDFDYIEVHTSTVSNFTPTVGTLSDRLYGAGVSVVTGAAFGVPLFVKFVAVDKNRPTLKSEPSAQGTATPSRLVGSDLDAGAITYEQLQFKDPGNIVPDGSFESVTYQALLVGRSASAWTFTVADRYHGDYAATINAATAPSTTRQLVLMSVAEAQQIIATDKLFCRFAYKGTAGATGVLHLVVEWTDQAGAVTTSTLPASLFNGTWQQAAGQLTAPTNCQNFRVYLELTSAGTLGTFTVDAVEVRRTIATEFIEDAAITNALIANLAVNNAKIGSVDVGKLTSGTINADMLVAGRFTTALAGNRVQLDSTGIRGFQGSSLTVHLDPAPGQLRIYNTTDASHTSTGHGIQFGSETGQNLIIDNNEILSRFNGTYGVLFLNREGGRVVLGGKVGGFAPGQEGVNIPKNLDHQVRIDSALYVQNTGVGDYPEEFPPFMVGRYDDQHIWIDQSAIGAVAAGDFADDLYINPRYQDGTDNYKHIIMASNSVAMRRIGPNNAFIRGWTGMSCAVQFIDSEVRITNGGTTAFVNVHALDFVQGLSDPAQKTEIAAFDPLAIVVQSPAKRFKYKRGVTEDDDAVHFGPMITDLPPELVVSSSDGKQGYGLASLVGVHHEAIRLLLERIEALEGKRGPQR